MFLNTKNKVQIFQSIVHIITGEEQITNIQAERLLFSGQLRVVLFSQSLTVQGVLASIGQALQVAVIEVYVRNSVYLYQTMKNVSLFLYRLFQKKEW